MFTIESISRILRKDERMKIKGFKTAESMHLFLNTANNALNWRVSDKNLKPGTYAFAGGQWHNVKNLDVSVLAHI